MKFMTNLFEGDVIAIACIAVIVLYLIYWYHKKNFSYWKDRGVPYLKPQLIFGSVKDEVLRRRSWHEFAVNVSKTFKDKGYGGIFLFTKPILVICNPDLIDKVLVEDFVLFNDRYPLNPDDPLSSYLLANTTGEKWRRMRSKIGPTFTSIKVKGMFEQIFKCSENIVMDISERATKMEPVEIDPLVFEFSTEAIASCTFGIQLLSDSTLRNNFQNAIGSFYNSSPIRTLKIFLLLKYGRLANLLQIKIISKPIMDLFIKLTKGTINQRKQSLIRRNDFLQMVIDLKEEEDFNGSEQQQLTELDKCMNQVGHSKTRVTIEEKMFTEDSIAALLFNFMQAGLQPSVVTISFTLFEISRNLEIQKKVQEEIDSAIFKHKRWNFEALKEMAYLDQVIQETLRLYTFNPMIPRIVAKTCKLPGSNLILEKGTFIYVNVEGLHMDPEYYPCPESFKPERFDGHNYKPTSSYLPFGNGPRICIGIRFAVMMMKICLARILFSYTIKPSKKMQLPLAFDVKNFYPKAKEGIWLEFDKRKNK